MFIAKMYVQLFCKITCIVTEQQQVLRLWRPGAKDVLQNVTKKQLSAGKKLFQALMETLLEENNKFSIWVKSL